MMSPAGQRSFAEFCSQPASCPGRVAAPSPRAADTGRRKLARATLTGHRKREGKTGRRDMGGAPTASATLISDNYFVSIVSFYNLLSLY